MRNLVAPVTDALAKSIRILALLTHPNRSTAVPSCAAVAGSLYGEGIAASPRVGLTVDVDD